MFFVDNDSKKHGKSLNINGKNYEIKAPSALLNSNFDKVVVGSICGENIIKQCKEELGIDEMKIDDFLVQNYQASLRNFLRNFAKICKEQNITGDVAELGVFQGDSAKVMNEIFEDKTLFLFDTFEGYDARDLNASKDNEAFAFGAKHLDDTSVEKVMAKMPNPHNIIIKKGWFPQSAKGLEKERFCFVDIDVDLYAPTLAGLEFFYPRLSKGGVIVVSYFAPHLGNKEAVLEFAKKHDFKLVPLGVGNKAFIIKKSG